MNSDTTILQDSAGAMPFSPIYAFYNSTNPATYTFSWPGGGTNLARVVFNLPSATYGTNYFSSTGLTLAAASGNTNLAINNSDPWFNVKNPTLDVSGSVNQALVVKGTVYATGGFTGNGAGLTNLSSSTPSPFIVDTSTANVTSNLVAGTYTYIKSSIANNLYLIGNGATTTVSGVAWVNTTYAGTNWYINF